MRVSVPAKIILFGEHAVVYSHPAIAVPVTALAAYADVEKNDAPLRVIADNLREPEIELDGDDALAIAVRLTLATIGVSRIQGTVRVTSDIPMSSGLGSGAAVTAAVVRAVAYLAGHALPNETVNRIVYEVEKIHHGTPSGIDNTVVVYGRAVYFVRGQALQAVSNAQSFTILIGDTGKLASTKETVGAIRRLYEADRARIEPVLIEIGAIVQAARQAMADGDVDVLGGLMNRNHALLRELTVSSPELERLVSAAVMAGAEGAKLSGGGGGGNMIALVSDETKATVQAALIEAGATRVIETVIGKMDDADIG